MTSFKKGLSVVVAVHNEEQNLVPLLKSVQHLADEIIVVNGESTDRTVQVAKQFGATVKTVPNQKMFHINKQIGVTLATYEWILNMDADEVITPQLVSEITTVVNGSHEEIDLATVPAFAKHMQQIAARDGIQYSQELPINGYFIARKNYFLGSYLMYSGVYPDGVIRLVRNGTSHWPAKSVHEQMVVEGGVSWLREPMIHMADPTFERYLWRANRYTDLTADEYQKHHVPITPLTFMQYMFWKPAAMTVLLFFRHKGFMDGWSGFVWSLMSGLHPAIAYAKYIGLSKEK